MEFFAKYFVIQNIEKGWQDGSEGKGICLKT